MNMPFPTGCAVLCSLVVMGTSTHYIGLVVGSILFVNDIRVWPRSSPDPFSVLALTLGLMSLLIVKPMYGHTCLPNCDALISGAQFYRLIVDFLRRGAFSSLIVTELCALGMQFVTVEAVGIGSSPGLILR